MGKGITTNHGITIVKETPTTLPLDCRPAEGFNAVRPVGAIIGVLAGTELGKVEVAIGVYDEKLDERTAQDQGRLRPLDHPAALDLHIASAIERRTDSCGATVRDSGS